MRKIEDIRPRKNSARISSIETEVNDEFSAEDFYAEAIAPPVPEVDVFSSPNFSERISLSKKKFIGKLIFAFLFFATVSVFCFISVVEAKNKIAKNFINLSSSFSSFSGALSSRNLSALANNIDQMNDKTTSSVLVLQSVGQDIYCFNLIYPQKKASKSTMMIDLVRSSHLITQSYSNIAKKGNSDRVYAADSDYLQGINSYLGQSEDYFNGLPKKITYAKFATANAKAIAGSADISMFSGAESTAVDNLIKLSDVSNSFFNYLELISQDIKRELTISGGKKSYLILFQNNTELRFGGGFLGSFARLDLDDGKIDKLDFETNIFSLDKGSASLKVASPPEFDEAFLSLRNANYSPDFAESSKKVIEMYQLEAGKKVDGVIGIDTTFFRELLKVAGPISMPEYNLTIDADNFLSDVQYQVEVAYFQNEENKKENEPKKILADMMPKLVTKLIKEDGASSALPKAISAAIKEKHFLVYSANENIEDLLDAINAAGKIHQPSGDYLYVANANIGGMKSSLNVRQTIDQEIVIDPEGNVFEQISITRDHQGSGKWPDGVNRNYVKIFLPLASTLNNVEGAADFSGPGSKKEPVSIFGKNTISYWQDTPPGTKTVSSVRFQRKISLDSNSLEYPINLQKQPGEEELKWNLTLRYPQGWEPENINGYDELNRVISLSEIIRADESFTLRFMRN